MERRIRNIFGGLLGLTLNFSGVVEKARRRIKDGHILPLYFHKPQKKLFDKIIIWLQENDFAFISTRELLSIIKRKEAPHKKMVWITFDDGWRTNIENVIPTIIKNDIPATFFVSTYPVETSGYFWWSAVKQYNKKVSSKYKRNLNELWRLPWPELKMIVDDLIKNEKVNQREAMNVQDLSDISKLQQVTIGSHGVYHLIPEQCSDKEYVLEFAESKLTLESWLGKSVKYFSYPKGIYSERERYILRECGYELAASTENSLIKNYVDPYLVPRHAVLDDGYFSEAICHVLGIWQPIKKRWSKNIV